MRGKYLSEIAAGTLLVAAASILIIPQINRGNKKRFAVVGERAVQFTTGVWDGIRNFGK